MSDEVKFDWYKIPGLSQQTASIEGAQTTPGTQTGVFSSASQVPETMLASDFQRLSVSGSNSANPINQASGIGGTKQAYANSGSQPGTALSGKPVGNFLPARKTAPATKTPSALTITDDDIPLSLKVSQLSSQEAKTYLRWYDDISSHNRRQRGVRQVGVEDVFRFLAHFGIPGSARQQAQALFARWAHGLSIGQFFALLRLLAHAASGEPIQRGLILRESSIPRPVPILVQNGKEASDSETTSDNDSTSGSDSDTSDSSESSGKKKLDLDSFTQFILTGERPVKHKKKPTHLRRGHRVGKKTAGRVKFSGQISYSSAPEYERSQPIVAVSGSVSQMPMGVIMQQRAAANPTGESDQDAPLPQNRFLHARVDRPASEKLRTNFAGVLSRPLAPNMTGSAPMESRRQSMQAELPQVQQPQTQQPQIQSAPSSPPSSANDFISHGTDRANMFLESALTGGTFDPSSSSNTNTGMQSPAPSIVSNNSHIQSLSSPPVPPRNSGTSQPQLLTTDSSTVANPGSSTKSTPFLPPKPQLTADQRQKYASTVSQQQTPYNTNTPIFNQGFIQGQQALPQNNQFAQQGQFAQQTQFGQQGQFAQQGQIPSQPTQASGQMQQRLAPLQGSQWPFNQQQLQQQQQQQSQYGWH